MRSERVAFPFDGWKRHLAFHSQGNPTYPGAPRSFTLSAKYRF
ncbi:hypothetical protein [Massilia atriviolacea]|nr:hypothetical protein [Massilia atriviolacea]